MRLRVGGGTGQALYGAVKQPTATHKCQLVGPELADRVLLLPTRWSMRSGDVEMQTRAPSVQRAMWVYHHACARRECWVGVGGQRRRSITVGMVGDIDRYTQCRNILWIRVVSSRFIYAAREGY